MSTAKHYACPTCKREIVWSDAYPWRPFCSERCRNEDLARWADGRYSIPGEPLPDPDSSADPDQD